MSASKIVMKIVRISFSVLVVVLVIFVLFKAGSYAYDIACIQSSRCHPVMARILWFR